MLSLIVGWLNGCQNFIVGRALYNIIGHDENVKSKLKGTENELTRGVLRCALEGLINQGNVKKSDESTDKDNHDIILAQFDNEWRVYYSKLNYLRSQLDLSIDNNEEGINLRAPIALNILDLDDQCEAIWAKRDYYLKHGRLAEVDEKVFEIPTDPKELAKLLQNIPRNIRRNRLKMQQPGAKALYAHLYTRYKDLYKQITGNEYVEKD